MTDELSDVHYTFLASTSESIWASHCFKQGAGQEELQVSSMTVVPTLLSGEILVFWEAELKLELFLEEE